MFTCRQWKTRWVGGIKMETIWKVTSSEWEVAWSRKDHAFPLSFSEPKTSKCKLAKVIGEKGQHTGTLQDLAWLP